MVSQRIKAVVFDVMGTLCDMSPLEARMEARGFSKAEAQASNPTVPRSIGQALEGECRV